MRNSLLSVAFLLLTLGIMEHFPHVSSFVPTMKQEMSYNNISPRHSWLFMRKSKMILDLEPSTKLKELKVAETPLANSGFSSRSLFMEDKQDNAAGEQRNEAESNEENNAENEEYEEERDLDEEELEARRRTATARAALLARQGLGSQRKGTPTKQPKRTSVGERRIGSATVSRQGSRATTKLVDAIRKTAQGTAAERTSDKNRDKNNNNDNNKNNPNIEKNLISSSSQSVIHNAIEELLRKHASPGFQPVKDDSKFSAAFATFGRSIGILGEATETMKKEIPYTPGATIIPPTETDKIAVRLATPSDDVDIANLRLSVFSDFSPELQSQFCARSCQAIAARRIRGATCVIATAPRKNTQIEGSQSRMILGTAECSFHEFFGTRLGRRREKDSILYITEVAVNPSARRRGIGSKLLDAIDILARERGIESLYLHVDVTNQAALNLYHQSGYHEIVSDDPMYLEFTTSLNLHPGATRGRDHFLLCKNLTADPTWLDDTEASKQQRNELIGTLGFEIPA